MDEMLKALLGGSIGSGSRRSLDGATTPIRDCKSEAIDYVIEYNRPTVAFQPGDLIEWKPGMKNVKFPKYGEPIMVLETFEAVRSSAQAGTPYEYTAMDMRCITFKDNDGDGDFCAYAFESRRMRKYVPGLDD